MNRRATKDAIIAFGLMAGFGLLAALYLAWGWSHDIAGLGGDNAGYLLAAQYFSPYQPASPLLSEYSKQIIYPPLFPWLLAISGGGESILVAHMVVIGFALGVMLVLFFWLRQESMPAIPSALVVLIFSAMPGTYINSLDVWTENSYLFFSLLAILGVWLGESERARVSKWLWVATASVAAATLIRVAALPLLAAFLLYLSLRRPPRWLLLAALATLPFAVWAIASSHVQVGISAYTGHWQEKYAADQVSLLVRQLSTESVALLKAWQYAWLGEAPTVAAKGIVLAFGTVSLVGWLYRLKDLAFDAIYVAIYGIVLLTWPHPEEALRYSYVLNPILLAYGFLMLVKIPARLPAVAASKIAVPMAVILLALAMLPTLLLTVKYFLQDVPAGLASGKRTQGWYTADRFDATRSALFHARLLAHLKSIADIVPEGECIFSIKPTIVSLYSKRISYAPPRPEESEEAFLQGITRCNYAYVLPGASPSYREPRYPLARLGTRAEEVSIQRLWEDGAVAGILLRIAQ